MRGFHFYMELNVHIKQYKQLQTQSNRFLFVLSLASPNTIPCHLRTRSEAIFYVILTSDFCLKIIC